jgi:hypothetical protein
MTYYPKKKEILHLFLQGVEYNSIIKTLQLNCTKQTVFNIISKSIKEGEIKLPEGIKALKELNTNYFNQLLVNAGLYPLYSVHKEIINKTTGYTLVKQPFSSNNFLFLSNYPYKTYLLLMEFINHLKTI